MVFAIAHFCAALCLSGVYYMGGMCEEMNPKVFCQGLFPLFIFTLFIFTYYAAGVCQKPGLIHLEANPQI